MLEGRSNAGGWLIVGLAVIALVAFTGLLYVRGGSGPPIALTGSAGSQAPATAAPGSAKPAPSGSGLNALASGAAAASGKPAASRAPASATSSDEPSPTAVVAGATSRPTPAPSHTPKPTRSPAPTVAASPTDSAATAYQLPSSPQKASVALANGQGGCAGFPAGGVLTETSFTLSGDRLSAKSPSGQRLSGTITAAGKFTLSASNPVERWIGQLDQTGGTGSYFIVSSGCTEGYETTIAFQ